jgi:hypothetical protein
MLTGIAGFLLPQAISLDSMRHRQTYGTPDSTFKNPLVDADADLTKAPTSD